MSDMLADDNPENMVRPLNGLIPTLSASAARLARLAGNTRFKQRLARLTQIHSLRISAQTNAFTPSSIRGLLGVQHATGNAQISFDLTPWPTLQMLAIDSASSVPDSVKPTEDHLLRSSLLEIFLQPVIHGLHSFGLEDIHFSHLALLNQNKTHKNPINGTPSKPMTVSFKLKNQEQDEAFLFTVNQIDTNLLGQLEKLLDDEQSLLSKPLAQTKIPGSALLGIQRLKIDTLYSLREGDILLNGIAATYHSLLSDRPSLDSIELIWGAPNAKRLRGIGKLEDQTIVIKDVPVISEEIEDSAMSDEEALDSLAQLEVPVRIEIDTVMLPLAQLSTLNAGYVIELPIPLNQAKVRLSTHGQTIGLGELVAVGDHLGIRITKISQLDDSAN